MPFSELDVRAIAGGKYKLLSDLNWRSPRGREHIRVPAGFVTDFASIPRGFRWLLTGHGGTRKPAVIHDYLYRLNVTTRKEADLMFKLTMRETNIPGWKRELAYRAVRLGGWLAWRKHSED